MTRPATLAAEIRAYCEVHSEPAKAGKWARYFREGYDAWGLLDKDNPLFTTQEEAWFTTYRRMGVDGFLKLGEILFRSPKYEEGALAIRFLTRFREELDVTALRGIERWFEAGIRNWAHTDALCAGVLAPLVAAGRIPWRRLGPWRESGFKYQRRAVPVSLLPLVKKNRHVRPLLEFFQPMMMDPERVVHQGLGWFLREAWKAQPAPVEALLAAWKDRAPRLIYQYATEKMSMEARARFKRAKRPR